jgi:CBS domain-containing protein
MKTATDISSLDPRLIQEFLGKTLPFSELDVDRLAELSGQFTLRFFPKETVIFRQDLDEVNDFYLIYSGGIKTYLSSEGDLVTLLDFRGEGSYFGALALIRGSMANFNVETVEDTWCLELEKQLFLDLVHNNPRFSQYYLRRFSDDLVTTAYAELRLRKGAPRPQEMLYLFNVQVGDVISRSPECIHASQTIQEAAERMSDLEIGSLLVQDQSGEIVGIVTDKDLRRKVVARGRDCSAPVAEVMTAPVKTIPSNAMCFDALLQMMNQRVHHLAVARGDRIAGMVSVHDIMVQQGASPLYLYREIINQRTIEGLYPLYRKVPRVVRALVEEGAKANNITKVISELNEQIAQRLLTLLDQQMGPAGFPFCWITFGSEGRREQTFKTDQDNAIIYDAPMDDEAQMKIARAHFRTFGREATQHLAACGYELCKGNMMASNPRWRKPYPVWEDYFGRWLNNPEPKEVLNGTIFFDFRPVYGQTQLGEDLRQFLTSLSPKKSFFLMHLARDCTSTRPPLTFFKNFVVEKDGKYKDRVDLKTQGLTPLVNFARLMALANGIRETNTVARLDALVQKECIPRELYLEAKEAYEFQMQLRLVHQLRAIESNQAPSNYIDPAELSDLERETLKEAFGVIGGIQAYVKNQFRVLE